MSSQRESSLETPAGRARYGGRTAKKSEGIRRDVRLGRVRFEAKYLAIQYFYTEKGWSIRWMCRQLGVSKAAYYKWLYRSIPQAEQENLVLAELIQEYDEQYNHILGYRRMTAWINRLNGTFFSKNRIHRIMQAIDVHSVIRKQPKKYRKSTPERTAENVLKRDFNASRPNEKWVTDVTEFKWYEGPVCHKLYLSAILDLYDRSVVSYVISRRNDNKLVFHTLTKPLQVTLMPNPYSIQTVVSNIPVTYFRPNWPTKKWSNPCPG